MSSVLKKLLMLTYTPTTVAQISNEIRKVIVGQEEVIEQILVAIFAEGHALLEGVPGTAKTLTVKTLARIVGAQFSLIQLTRRRDKRCGNFRHYQIGRSSKMILATNKHERTRK